MRIVDPRGKVLGTALYSPTSQISLRVLDALATARENQQARGGEPLVVLSHSMGGQIVYDLVTHFLPRLDRYAGVRIDYWAAAASQIGLFEEMKLFLASDPATGNVKCPHPGHERY